MLVEYIFVIIIAHRVIVTRCIFSVFFVSFRRLFHFMLYDMDYSDCENIKPAFFRAQLEHGAVIVPDWNSEEVRK